MGEKGSVGDRSYSMPGTPNDKGRAQNIAVHHQYVSAGIAAEGLSQLRFSSCKLHRV